MRGVGYVHREPSDDDARQREQAVLEDAPGASAPPPDELRDALDAQVDRAVQDGRLTQEQADEGAASPGSRAPRAGR